MAPVLSDGSRLVTFKGGFVASVEVVQRLLAIEARGAKFVALAGGRFKVEPVEILTAEDTTVLESAPRRGAAGTGVPGRRLPPVYGPVAGTTGPVAKRCVAAENRMSRVT